MQTCDSLLQWCEPKLHKIDNKLKNDNQHTNTMKKILLVCAAMGALLVSCSKEKDYSDMIVATWDCVSIATKITLDDGQIYDEHEIEGEEITFFSDGVCFTNMTGHLSGNHYLIEKDYLVMINDNSSIRYKLKISSMTSDKCVLVYKEEGVNLTSYESPEPGGFTGNLVETFTLMIKE